MTRARELVRLARRWVTPRAAIGLALASVVVLTLADMMR